MAVFSKRKTIKLTITITIAMNMWVNYYYLMFCQNYLVQESRLASICPQIFNSYFNLIASRLNLSLAARSYTKGAFIDAVLTTFFSALELSCFENLYLLSLDLICVEMAAIFCVISCISLSKAGDLTLYINIWLIIFCLKFSIALRMAELRYLTSLYLAFISYFNFF